MEFLWLGAAVGAYFLFAFSSLADRYLLAGPLPHPRVYAFYTGITGFLAALLIPLGVHIPSVGIAFLALFAGAISLLGLYASYRAVFHSGVTRIVPMVGAFFPLFTALLVFLSMQKPVLLSPYDILAFIFFIGGTVLLSLRGTLADFVPSWADLKNALLVGFLFALSFVLAKELYTKEGFLTGFVWMRWGAFLAAASFLLFPKVRKTIFEKRPIEKKKVYVPFLVGKGTGAVAFMVQQYAISIAKNFQLTAMSALQGVQYFFLLVFVAILSVKRPQLLREEFSGVNALWRIAGALAISLGFVFLAL